MTSPICTVNGNTTGNGVNVAANASVTIALADTAGVKSWSLRCISTDENQVAATITSGLTVNQITKTATFTSPNVADGTALIFESEVNDGLDVNGRVDPTLTTRFGVYVPTSSGNLRVGAFDETLEGNAAFGWTAKLNAGIRQAGAAALTPAISGTLPITVNNTNPLAPVIGINAATTLAAGSMSSSDKAKVDGATAIPSSSKIAMYDASGNLNAIAMVASSLQSSTGTLALEIGGVGSPLIEMTDGPTITANYEMSGLAFTTDQHKLQTQQNLVRVIPLHWSACKVGGVVSWSINDTSDIVNDVADPFANLHIECYFPNGAHVTKIQIRNKGAGSGPDPLPANPPTFSLYRKPIVAGTPALLGTANATLDATYRGTFRTTDITIGNHIVDSTAYRYYIVITPEFGANALAGCMVRGAFVERFFPAGFPIGLE